MTTADGLNPSLQINDCQKGVVAIPAFNEEKRIASVVDKCLKAGCSTIWVIDDGSSDRTIECARKAGAEVLQHSKNLGKGMAIRTALNAFNQSSYEYLIFMDADGQHDPTFLPLFIQQTCQLDADLVIGNRMLSIVSMPFVRRLTNQLMSWIVSFLSGQEIPDSQCGYRLVSRRFAHRFHPTTYHFDLESEMIIQAGRLNLRIHSVPISTIYEGQSSHIDPIWDTGRFLKLMVRYLK